MSERTFDSDVKDVLWTLARARYVIGEHESAPRRAIARDLEETEQVVCSLAAEAGCEVRPYSAREVARAFIEMERAKRPDAKEVITIAPEEESSALLHS